LSTSRLIEYARLALEDELFSSVIYRKLADFHRGKIRSKLINIAEMEEEHANFWLNFLKKRGVRRLAEVNRIKVSIYAALFRILGLGLTLRLLEMGERDAVELYSKMLEDPSLSSDEREKLKKILEDELVHEQEFIDEESRFEDFLNHVRDIVLGMNDGLVEVLSVASGLAGVYGDPFHVALGGLIVGTGGALSMGIGAYASVKAQRQVHEGTLNRVKMAAKYVAHILTRRVAEYMVRKGYRRKIAEEIAEESGRKTHLLARIIAEEEYGIREEKLEEPAKAGIYTGVSYAVGALVPLIPYIINLPIGISIALSLVLAGLALAVTGFIIAISANLPIRRKIAEMILAGLGSAGTTFAIGRLASIILGVEVS